MGQVDLRVCQAGDLAFFKSGEWLTFVEFVPEGAYKGEARFRYRNGSLGIFVLDNHPFIRVERDGKVITPAAEFPNAGPGCDPGRYRTGEVPQVGDVVFAHGEGHMAFRSFGEINNTRQVVVAINDTVNCVTIERRQSFGSVFNAARFDLLSRAPEPSAEVGEDSPRCRECQDACLGEGVDVRDGLCGACQQYVEPSAAPGDAVITKPGKYRTADFDEYGKPQWIAEVIGQAGPDGKWLGCVGPYACWWNSDGLADRHNRYDITGPFVAPPKPVRQQLRDDAEWLEDIMSDSLEGHARPYKEWGDGMYAIAKRLRELADELQPS